MKPMSSKREAARDGMTDDELVTTARSGDKDAFDELYRRHAAAARRTARAMLGSRQEADDVVADAFVGVMRAIDAGTGPRDNFRAYLMACVRNGCKMTWRSKRSLPKDPAAFDDGSLVFEDPERYVEAGIVAAAFSSLSPCWQQTLWLTAVEGKGTDEVARQLRRAPSAVPALALRAREAFAEAYLTQHMARAGSEHCKRVAPKLAGYVRNHVGDGDRMRIDTHLAECPECTSAIAGLRDVNTCLRSLALPVGLGALAASGIGAGGAGGVVTATVLSAGAGASVSGSGLSGAGIGALLVKFAAVVALASPVVAYEVSRPTLTARAESATASTTSTGPSTSSGAGAGSGGAPPTGGTASGDAPVAAGGADADDGTSTGAPPAPPTSSTTPAVAIPGLGADPSSQPDVGDILAAVVPTATTPIAAPVTVGAVAVGGSSSSAAAVGASVAGAQTAVGAMMGPDNVAVGVGVGLPLGLGDGGIAASVGSNGITVATPSTPTGSVPTVHVPVPLPVAPVIAPAAGPVVGLLGGLLVGVHP